MIGLYQGGDQEAQADSLIAKLLAPISVEVNATIKATTTGTRIIDYMIAYEKFESYWKYATYNGISGENNWTAAANDYAKVIGPFNKQLAFQDIFKPIAGKLLDHFLGEEIKDFKGTDFAKKQLFHG